MVCAGYDSTQSLVTVVKSIMFYRSRPIHFHLLVDETSKRTLKTLFDTWNLPQGLFILQFHNVILYFHCTIFIIAILLNMK